MKCYALAVTLALAISAGAFAQVPNQKPTAPPTPRKNDLAQRGGRPVKQVAPLKKSGKGKNGKSGHKGRAKKAK
jgi:hypothetical protein